MFSVHKYITPLDNYDVPQSPYKRPYGGTPGPPVMYEKPSDPEDESAGYGYTNAEATAENDIYFYHSDHLGSTSYITDKDGNATQFVCYKPYGERGASSVARRKARLNVLVVTSKPSATTATSTMLPRTTSHCMIL